MYHRIVTLFLCIFCVLSFESAHAQNNEPPNVPSIVFISMRDSRTREIYTMHIDGSNVVQLTDGGDGEYIEPEWSPDGSQILFLSNHDGDWEIFVMNFDGTDLRQLTNNTVRESSARWSPTGLEILFISQQDEQPGLYIMDMDSNNVHYLETVSVPNVAFWSGDGSQIAYATGDSGVNVMNSDGSVDRIFVAREQEDQVRGPNDYLGYTDWSPDSSKLVAGLGSTEVELLLFDLASSVWQNPVSDIAGLDLGMRWSTDGNSTIFFSTRANIYAADIFIADGNGRNPRQITDNELDDYYPDLWVPLPEAGETSNSASSQTLDGVVTEVRSQNGRNINARSTPSTTGTIVASIPNGTIVTVVDAPQQADGYTWRQVILPNNEMAWMVEQIGDFRVLNPIVN